MTLKAGKKLFSHNSGIFPSLHLCTWREYNAEELRIIFTYLIKSPSGKLMLVSSFFLNQKTYEPNSLEMHMFNLKLMPLASLGTEESCLGTI